MVTNPIVTSIETTLQMSRAVPILIVLAFGIPVSILRPYGQSENLTCPILKEGSLEAQDCLRIEDWRRLRPTTIDILLGVVEGWTFPMLQDLISSENLTEHDS